jgi:spore coat protein CotH
MWWAWGIACTQDVAVTDDDAPATAAPRDLDEEGVGDAPPPVVDDTEPPPVEDTGEPPPLHEEADDGDDILYGDDVVELHLEIDGVSLAGLEEDPEDDQPARVIWEGQVWEDVGVRLKGSWSFRDMDGKAAFKIDFGDHIEGQTFRGVRHVTLNNMVQDDTMLHEHVFYWLCHQLGIPAPRHGYARVYVNDELFGLYGIVETMDEDYLARAWPDDPDGNLYEAVGADLTWDRSWLRLEVSGGEAPVEDDLGELIDALETAPPTDHLAALAAQFDTGGLFRYLAQDAASGNFDGYVYGRNNYLVYHAPREERWYFTPWGVDQSFERYTNLTAVTGDQPVVGALVVECLQTPECTAVYADALRDVVAVWESVDAEGYARATWDRIEADCESDPRREHSCEPDFLFDFLRTRPEAVRTQLSGL